MVNYNGVPLRTVTLPNNKIAIKGTYPMVATGVTAHNTYNDASADNEIKYMHRNDNYVSYHIAVDDKEAIIGVPFERSTWHAGDGVNGYGNRNHISVEICYSKSGGERYRKAEANAVKVIAKLLHDRNWSTSKLKKHQDWSGKYCPHRILAENRWSSFVQRVADEIARLNKGAGGTQTVSTPSTGKTSPSAFKVGDVVTVQSSATNYATGQPIASFVKGSSYKVKQVKSDRVLLDAINSWVFTKDVIKGTEAHTSVSNSKPTNLSNLNKTLKRGARGDDVRELQRMLCNVYFYPNKQLANKGVDGIYGADTENAVRRFQMVYLPFEVDGIAGKNTIAKLKALQ